jgi:YD repeat-containing protein
MKVWLRHVVLVLSICTVISASGQLPEAVSEKIGKSMPKPMPTTPNVASLGRFGNYEVSNYTGLPEISIPIFEIKSGTLTVPITLNYHASGVRMLDAASWVGLGWALNTGGQVSRETRGDPDEKGYYAEELLESLTMCGPTATWWHLDLASNDVIDTQPDIFSYSFAGQSGKFTLGKRGLSPAYLFPYAPIKIWHDGYNSTGNIFDLNQFKITDTEGVLYHFGSDNAADPSREYVSVQRGAYASLTSTTAWLLTSITAPNSSDRISYTYTEAGWVTRAEPTNSITVLDNCQGNSCPEVGLGVLMTGENSSTAQQLVPSEITFKGGKVKFILSSSPRSDLANVKSLDRIEVYSEVNGVYTLIKTVNFIYEYFSDGTSSTSRLKLKELRFIGSDQQIDNRYKFQYHTDAFSWGTSMTNAYSKDFFGYYNGKTNQNLIPAQTVEWIDGSMLKTLSLGAADRNTVPTYMKEGMLKKITFPTGGYTEFDYETHQYQENNVAKYAGGLRVSSIKSYDGTGAAPITKTYKYGIGETGYGVKNFYNELLYYYSESMIKILCCIELNVPGVCASTSYRQRTFFGSSTLEINSSEGSPVVYPYVTEYFGTNPTNIGKIVYEYDNGNFTADTVFHVMGPKTSRVYKADYSWKRGKLTKRSVYDKANKLKQETAYSYRMFQKQSKHVGTTVERFTDYPKDAICNSECVNEFGDPIDANQIVFRTYNQPTGALMQIRTEDRIYDDAPIATALTTIASLDRDPVYLQVTEQVRNGETEGEEIVERSKYPFQYTFSGGQTDVARAIQNLWEKNILSKPIEQYAIRRNTDGSNARVIAGSITTYVMNPNYPGYIVPKEMFFLESSAPVPLNLYIESSIANASTLDFSTSLYKSRIEFLSFDGKGNATEVKRTHDQTISYLYDALDRFPIAEVSNTDKGELPDTYVEEHYETTASYSSNITTTNLSPTLVIQYQQPVVIKVTFTRTQYPNGAATADIVLKKSGTVVYDPPAYGFGSYETVIELTPGTYTFAVTGTNASGSVRCKIEVEHKTKSTLVPKVFHTSFEETGSILTEAKTGKKVYLGPYTLALPTINGNYRITWWDKTGTGKWIERQSLITVPYVVGGVTQSTFVAGTGATYVDELRLYPENARMSTITSDPILGVTSSTDQNNRTTYYTYDSMGRLKSIKDENGKIISSNAYHFATKLPQ